MADGFSHITCGKAIGVFMVQAKPEAKNYFDGVASTNTAAFQWLGFIQRRNT